VVPHVLAANMVYLVRALGATLAFSAACMVAASIIGVAVALMQVFGAWPTRLLASCYLHLMRGVPLIVMIIGVYYVLPYTGLDLDANTGGVIVVSLYFGAFMSEVFRAALRSVPRGQWDAGRALGMHGWPLMQIVIVPQALRLAGPPAISTCIMLVKGTSIISVIGVWELTMAGQQVVERTLAPFQIFGGVALLYFIVCGSLALCGHLLERRLGHAI
jgi:His/Glu/Gln/Arg/opine family amino acid ABC transporter permease subunit